jgi:UDP-galactopyranose mutase
MRVDWVIVGAGFTGATLAERIATQLDQKVLIVDQRDHIGGNAFDYYDEHGILVHRYGPHIFHTSSSRVWSYLSRFTQWRPYYHHVLGVIDGKKAPVPFNLNSLYALYPARHAAHLEEKLLGRYEFGARVPILRLRECDDADLRSLAGYIYEKVFHGYTVKQWELTPEELDASVTGRVPVHISRDDRYFQDTYQAMPRHGYTEMFRGLLRHPNIRILLNTPYHDIADEVHYRGMIYTGPMDEYFGYEYGPLPYRSLTFALETIDQEFYQEVGTVNYPNEYDFTRITEQKHITGQKAPKTTIITEYPRRHVVGESDPYYPIPREQNREHYSLYTRMADELRGKVYFAGRLADYKYYNMDQAVARALKLFDDEIAENGRMIPVPAAALVG